MAHNNNIRACNGCATVCDFTVVQELCNNTCTNIGSRHHLAKGWCNMSGSYQCLCNICLSYLQKEQLLSGVTINEYQILLEVQKLLTIHFNHHLHAYNVEHPTPPVITYIHQEQLLDPVPLRTLKLSQGYFIVCHHCITPYSYNPFTRTA